MGIWQSRSAAEGGAEAGSAGQTPAEPVGQSDSPTGPVTTDPPPVIPYFSSPTISTHTHSHPRPTLLSIQLVSRYLMTLGLPPELLSKVLDEAEYFAACTRRIKKKAVIRSRSSKGHVEQDGGPFVIGQEHEVGIAAFQPGGGLKNQPGQVWYLVSSPVGCIGRPSPPTQVIRSSGRRDEGEVDTGEGVEWRKSWVRKVVIETVSRDQGWIQNDPTYYGTYEGSFSWFEITLLRGTDEVEGSRCSVQNNIHAGQYYKDHTNTLYADHPTVKLARPGDRFVLWARAQYPGWQNHLLEASITVYTSLYPPS
ncbi:hypothetical protein IAU60_001776 [Kwoniella sp. DSM 27419]